MKSRNFISETGTELRIALFSLGMDVDLVRRVVVELIVYSSITNAFTKMEGMRSYVLDVLDGEGNLERQIDRAITLACESGLIITATVLSGSRNEILYGIVRSEDIGKCLRKIGIEMSNAKADEITQLVDKISLVSPYYSKDYTADFEELMPDSRSLEGYSRHQLNEFANEMINSAQMNVKIVQAYGSTATSSMRGALENAIDFRHIQVTIITDKQPPAKGSQAQKEWLLCSARFMAMKRGRERKLKILRVNLPEQYTSLVIVDNSKAFFYVRNKMSLAISIPYTTENTRNIDLLLARYFEPFVRETSMLERILRSAKLVFREEFWSAVSAILSGIVALMLSNSPLLAIILSLVVFTIIKTAIFVYRDKT